MTEPAKPNPQDEITLLIEWPDQRGGIEYASLGGRALEELQQQSEKALNIAMGQISLMSRRVTHTMQNLDRKFRPDEAEIEFGVNLDSEVGALIAKASGGAQFKIKLKWNIAQPDKPEAIITS